MNICNQESKKEPFWVTGKLYQGKMSKKFYLYLENNTMVLLESGTICPEDNNTQAYTECTDQYCLQKVA